MKTLHLNLKKKWFDMIASGEKKEEYREIKEYWIKRFMIDVEVSVKSDITNYKSLSGHIKHKSDLISFGFEDFNSITFRNGYSKTAPTIVIEFKGFEVGYAKPEWSDNWQGEVFILKLGNTLS